MAAATTVNLHQQAIDETIQSILNALATDATSTLETLQPIARNLLQLGEAQAEEKKAAAENLDLNKFNKDTTTVRRERVTAIYANRLYDKEIITKLQKTDAKVQKVFQPLLQATMNELKTRVKETGKPADCMHNTLILIEKESKIQNLYAYIVITHLLPAAIKMVEQQSQQAAAT